MKYLYLVLFSLIITYFKCDTFTSPQENNSGTKSIDGLWKIVVEYEYLTIEENDSLIFEEHDTNEVIAFINIKNGIKENYLIFPTCYEHTYDTFSLSGDTITCKGIPKVNTDSIADFTLFFVRNDTLIWQENEIEKHNKSITRHKETALFAKYTGEYPPQNLPKKKCSEE